ncbi:hypothetical protein RHSIM_Rhsim04G0019900 [Rhododendron simsii]|uniref:Uncharacterized protein n=1 Tax=Rhododendron simsii TaxID=118357 RepID=A0A834H0C9_RHOSS|nr:hypothetical protein RHSIM_Rhsim04G0019900 [Rhododendron simsii]
MLNIHKFNSAHNKISSPLFPVLVEIEEVIAFLLVQVCWGLGYVVATLSFGVVEMSIDTVILLLLDSYDPRMQKESKSNLAGGGGSGGGVGITGMGEGIGYGSGSGWGGGFGGGRGYGVGSGHGGGLGIIGCETCLPARSCACPCQVSGGWGELQSHSKSAAHLEPKLAESTGIPSVGITGMGTGPIVVQPPYNPYPSVGSCPCPCPEEGGWGVIQSHSKSAAHLEPEFAGRMVMPGGGSNIAANNDPISSNASMQDQEGHQARNGYGPFEFAKNDGEPAPPDRSATERNEMEDHKVTQGKPHGG